MHTHNTCRLLEELQKTQEDLEGSMKDNLSLGASQLQSVETKMSDLQEAINNDLKAVSVWGIG